MIYESFIKFRQAVGKVCTIPFSESTHFCDGTKTQFWDGTKTLSRRQQRTSTIHKGQMGAPSPTLGEREAASVQRQGEVNNFELIKNILQSTLRCSAPWASRARRRAKAKASPATGTSRRWRPSTGGRLATRCRRWSHR